jgi:hypothetical protein
VAEKIESLRFVDSMFEGLADRWAEGRLKMVQAQTEVATKAQKPPQ